MSPPPASANVLAAARWFRGLGLNVIELPYRQKWRNGWRDFQSRWPSDTELEGWLDDGRRHNLAVVNGAISTNAVSIDVDDALLFESMLDASGLQRGPVRSLVTKGKRGGHLWVRSRVRVATDPDIATHVELRGEGSITVVPPSVHPEGQRYRIHGFAAGLMVVEDAEAWLRALLAHLGVASKPKEARRAIDPVELLTKSIARGGRNKTLTRIGGYLHNRLPLEWTASLLHAINVARCSEPLDASEVDAIVRSLSRYPQSQLPPAEAAKTERAFVEGLLA